MDPELFYTVSRELRTHMPAQAVLLSAASFYHPCKTRKNPLRVPNAMAKARWSIPRRGADCGAYTATMRWGGVYRFTPRNYIDWLYPTFRTLKNTLLGITF
jgi:hypothetical protein